MKYITTVDDKQFTIDINRDGQVTVDGQVIDIEIEQMLDSTMYSIIIGGESHDIRMTVEEDEYEVLLSGEIFDVTVEDERTRRLAGLKGSSGVTGEVTIKAPMPGVVVEILVEVGQEVAKGDVVLILESMKMQNEFKSPRDGTVKNIRVNAGDTVDQNAVLLMIV
ncbi:biotin/lipoyl-containing protein [Anaerolineales bacterium HSG6]|nr:biotin/lipoyl-containing protein [Anaerolineales bacterium HSG6]MDM8530323.1 biotin/lipoyl-containing protein [Anaerolineales bacterium HSG25]